MSRNVEDVYQLTPLQQGMLFQTVLAPSSGVYVEQAHLTLAGELRTDAFWDAWQGLFDRHPALRSTFHWEEIDKPVQVVHRAVPLPRDEVDLRELDEQAQQRRLAEFVARERRAGLDLQEPPLLRITLFRLADERYRVMLRISHLVVDGWSIGILLDEFIRSYRAGYHGERPALATAGAYRDYVAWWSGRDPSAVREFWQDYFAGADTAAPLEFGSSTEDTSDGITHGRVDLPLDDLADELRAFARQHQVTLHTVMQGAWMAALGRCAGRDEVVTGATMAHRPNEVPRIGSTVGPMLVTVPVRARLGADVPVLDWLRRLQDTVTEVRDHAAAPLTDIRGWAGMSRSSELFETIISFENVPLPALEFPAENLALEDYFFDGRPQYAFGFVVLPGEDIPLRLVYDRRRFCADDAWLMLHRVRQFLVSLLAAPATPLGELELLGESERERLAGLHRRQHTEPVASTLPRVVAAHAERDPDAPAVSDVDTTLSYAELCAQANRLANHLIGAGVRPGDRVALCVSRSVRAIVAMLAVHAAGAAYVPLDPDNPARRLAFILADCAPTVVLTETAHADVLAADVPRVLLDADADTIAAAADTTPGVPTGGDDLAYLIYTSGSTGEPKGVRTSHENVLRLTRSTSDHVAASPADVWACTHSFAFDVSVWEIWGALWHGSELVVVPGETARDPRALLECYAQRGITGIMATPKEFEALIAADAAADEDLAATLRFLVLGGERVDVAALRPWFDNRGPANPRVLNCYGPTEATCYCVTHEITPQDVAERGSLSVIGRPVPDTSVYLLDENLRPVPYGATGEICVAGPGNSAGYLDRPELTAARFVPEPGPEGTGTLYRTGDLGRYDEAGRIVYLGRADAQVKIRGYRIELGEIGAALRAQPGVQDAAVAVRPAASGAEQLVGYVVGADADPDGVRDGVRALLPEYMVPAAVLAVPEIPLTAAGKLDTAALADPQQVRPAGRAPAAGTEQELAGLLGEVLGVTGIPAEANLIDLGMHSLVANTVLAKIREHWPVPLPLRSLFAAPTVAELAAIIEGGGSYDGGRPGEVDLTAEITLEEAIRPDSPAQPAGEREQVLLTGGTGMLGGALLADLLSTSDAVLHCLVRADDAATGLARLRENVSSLGDWRPEYESRIVPVPGSLAKPRLGLTADAFTELASTVDHIYHCGASVNFVHPYRRLRASNVAGTVEILRLACTGPATPLSYVSSGAVLGQRLAEQQAEPLAERPLGPVPPALSSGYAQSKWVAEHLVAEAGRRGLPVAIHRGGRIVGDSRTGAWSGGDATAEMLRVSAHLGAVPDLGEPMDMTPIDFVVAAIRAVPPGDPDTSVLHLSNPVPTVAEDIVAGFAGFGRELASKPVAEWYADLLRASRVEEADLGAAVTLFGQWVHDHRNGRREPVFGTGHTTAVLAGRASCPRVDGDVLARYLRYLDGLGALDRPGTKRSGNATQG